MSNLFFIDIYPQKLHPENLWALYWNFAVCPIFFARYCKGRNLDDTDGAAQNNDDTDGVSRKLRAQKKRVALKFDVKWYYAQIARRWVLF